MAFPPFLVVRSSASLEHRSALLDEGAGGLLVVLGFAGADHAGSLAVERRGERAFLGHLHVLLHVPPGNPWTGGQSVTINGTNLSGATSVTFGGTAGAITSNTATTIVVTTPAHGIGAVDVVVTTPGGSATSTGGYTYASGIPTLSEWMLIALAAALMMIAAAKLR